MAINRRISFDRILCPIDFTQGSDESLRYAIALAKAYRAKLFVMNSMEGYAVSSSADRQRTQERLDAAVRKYLRPPMSADFSWESLVVDGEPDASITHEAAKREIDLIAMRSRRRPYAAALLGSTAESVCRTAPCPVMITHRREQEWAGVTTNEIGLQKVLVAYDFSSDSELAFAYGLSLAQEYQAEVHFLHVLPVGSIRPTGAEIAFLPLEADNGFGEAARRLHNSVPADTRLWCNVKESVRAGHPYREILSYAIEQNIDLICMGASGTGHGKHALFGSNSDRVLRQAPCPVLITRPLRQAIATLTA